MRRLRSTDISPKTAPGSATRATCVLPRRTSTLPSAKTNSRPDVSPSDKRIAPDGNRSCGASAHFSSIDPVTSSLQTFCRAFLEGIPARGRIWLVSTFSARLDPDRRYGLNARFGSLADILTRPHPVRFTPNGRWAAHPSQHLAVVYEYTP